MEPATIAAIASVAGGVMSMAGGASANRAKRREAEKNRYFQAQQSATAHQRQVADMRAAGLNPILSATGGAGASTSAGSMAQQEDIITPAVDTAGTAYRTYLEGQNVKSTNAQIEQQTKKLKAETTLTEEQTKVTSAGLPKALSQAEVWVQILRALKGIEKNIIEPIIKRLTAPGTGKAISDAIQDAKNLVGKVTSYPGKQYERAKQKLTTPKKGVSIDEDSNFILN